MFKGAVDKVGTIPIQNGEGGAVSLPRGHSTNATTTTATAAAAATTTTTLLLLLLYSTLIYSTPI